MVSSSGEGEGGGPTCENQRSRSKNCPTWTHITRRVCFAQTKTAPHFADKKGTCVELLRVWPSLHRRLPTQQKFRFLSKWGPQHELVPLPSQTEQHNRAASRPEVVLGCPFQTCPLPPPKKKKTNKASCPSPFQNHPTTRLTQLADAAKANRVPQKRGKRDPWGLAA